ncbi:MAG: hypothetical protein WAK18_12090 [Nocardioidaceae bacterium]
MFSRDDEDDDFDLWEVIFAAVGFLAGFGIAGIWFESGFWRMVVIGVVVGVVVALANRLRLAWTSRRTDSPES